MTLDMAARLVQAALPQPELPFETAQELVQYHLARNRQARRSHRKTWPAKRLRTPPQK